MHTGRRLEEGGARPPFDSSRAGMFSVRKAGWSRARGSLKIPMTNVQNIRLLSREELNDLSRKMARQQLRFERALFEVPGLALLVVETWKRRQSASLVTGALSRHYRDGSDTDWNQQIDRRLGAVARLLERPDVPREKIVERLVEAELSLELLREFHGLLVARMRVGRRPADTEERERLGLHREDAKRAMARAARAYAAYRDLVRTIAYHNIRLVMKCARRFENMGVPLADLIQEGHLGLIRAIEKFDGERGFMFSTYGVWWIQQSLIRAIQNQRRTVRVPSHICELQVRYRNLEEDLFRARGRAPEAREMAQALGVSKGQVEIVETSLIPVRSIHTPVANGDALLLEETLADDSTPSPLEQLDRDGVRSVLGSVMEDLTPRERRILSWRYGLGEDGDPLTLGEIGSRLGISRERVRQIEAAALKRLRREPELRSLRASLELPSELSAD